MLAYEESANRDTNKMESVATMQEVLKQAQEFWRTADADSRLLKFERNELDAKMKSLRIELDTATRREADGQRDAASASLVQARLSSAQAEFVTERTKVSELNSELSAAKLQLRDWDEQYDWQYRAGAGSNDQPPENKDPTARRLIQQASEEEPPRTPPPRTRPEEPGSAATDLRNPVASPTHSQAEVLSATAAKFKEAERIRISAWPKPASYRQWRMNLVDEILQHRRGLSALSSGSSSCSARALRTMISVKPAMTWRRLTPSYPPRWLMSRRPNFNESFIPQSLMR